MNDIHWIIGHDPLRKEEYPFTARVGSYIAEKHAVVKIVARTDNRGDHGIGWFDVFTSSLEDGAETKLYCSVNERHVAEVYYKQEEHDEDHDN